jgi:hypothetical protein
MPIWEGRAICVSQQFARHNERTQLCGVPNIYGEAYIVGDWPIEYPRLLCFLNY